MNAFRIRARDAVRWPVSSWSTVSDATAKMAGRERSVVRRRWDVLRIRALTAVAVLKHQRVQAVFVLRDLPEISVVHSRARVKVLPASTPESASRNRRTNIRVIVPWVHPGISATAPRRARVARSRVPMAGRASLRRTMITRAVVILLGLESIVACSIQDFKLFWSQHQNRR